jgi:predicted nucleic acid-binding protein
VNTHGNPKRIISAWQQGVFDLLTSSANFDEVERVLRCPRIVKRHKQDETAIQRFLKLLENEAIIVDATDVLGVVKDDEATTGILNVSLREKRNASSALTNSYSTSVNTEAS